MKPIIAALLALALTGCASMINGKDQTIVVTALDTTGATYCTAKNDKGTYRARSGSAMRVKRSSGDLVVKCENRQQEASTVIESSNEWWYYPLDFVALDLCLVSCVVDTANGSIYEYPAQSSVMMDYKSEVVAGGSQ